MQLLSVVIITFNEEQNIARCINSVKCLADEIIVLDSYSTDNTPEIARELGAFVYQEKFRGYIGQKNLAMRFASNDYILSLDADEVLDDVLVQSIMYEKKTFEHRAYKMNRCTNFCGRYIRHGLWYPDQKIRLFDRRIGKWGGMNPHDRIELKDGFTSFHLKGDILHYSFNSIDDHVWQNNRLSSIAAASMYNKGKRSSWFRIMINPTWAFINGYFFRRGFLDGTDGFTIAINTAHQVFLKYTKLHRLQKIKHKKVSPAMSPKIVSGQKSIANEF
jgi:glycosyltransferase involved in cell wall biosynthesis